MTYPPPNYPPPPRVIRNRPWWKATWLLVAVTAIIGIGIGIGIGAAGGSSSNKPAAAKTVTLTQTATATATTIVGPTVTAKPTIVKVVATKTHVKTVTYTPPPQGVFSDGTYKVGPDIRSGEYRTDGEGDGVGCYYERDSNLNGDIESIITNDNFDGPTRLTVRRGEYLKVSGGCQWRRA